MLFKDANSIFDKLKLTYNPVKSGDSSVPVLIQAPNILIYKNNINVYTGKVEALYTTKESDRNYYIPPTKVPITPQLVNLSINSDNNVSPNTATLQFALPTIEADSPVTFVSELDFPSINQRWYLMDHIEIWISPHVGIAPYVRSFVGCVTQLSFEIKENIYTFTVYLKDMMYWLDQARVQTTWSIFDLALRRPKDFINEGKELQWTIYKNRFAGLNFKHLIEKVLFNKPVIVDRQKNEKNQDVIGSKVELFTEKYDEFEREDFNVLPMYSGGDILAILSLTGQQNPGMQFPYSKKYREFLINKLKQSDVNNILDKLPNGKEGDITNAVNKTTRDSLRPPILRSNSPITETDIAYGGVGSWTDYMELVQSQKRNFQAISLYWELQFMNYIRNNYIALFRDEDILMMPYPFESTEQTPLVFEGTFATRGQILRQLSEHSLYEIYQSHQGYIFVKPPLYNAPPVNQIYPVEISDITRQENLDNVLTSATTEGVIVFRPERSKDNAGFPQVQIPKDNNPFVLGSYQILFPKNAPKFQKEVFDFSTEETAFKIPINSALTANSILHDIIRESTGEKARLSNVSITIYEQIDGKRIKGNINQMNSKDLTKFMLYKFYRNTLEIPQVATLNLGEDTEILKVRRASEIYFGYLQDFLESNKEHFGIANKDDKTLIRVNSAVYSWILTNVLNKYSWQDGLNVSQVSIEDQRIKTLQEYINGSHRNGSLYRTIQEALETPASKFVDFKAGVFDGKTTEDFVKSLYQRNEYIKDQDLRSKTLEKLIIEIGKARPRPELPIIVLFITGKFNMENQRLKTISTGEFNIAQHGLRDVKLTNPLVRSNLGAVAFSKYFLYKNNVMAHVYTFTLKSLRLDIVPGFPILNTLDFCVYYVLNVSLSIIPGEDTQTVLTCVARRRPVFMHVKAIQSIFGTQASTNTNINFQNELCRILSTWESDRSTIDGLDTFVSDLTAANNPNYKFIGWEMYGPSDNDLGEFFTKSFGEFLPPFGGYLTAATADLGILTLSDGSTVRIENFTFIGISENPNGEITLFIFLPRQKLNTISDDKFKNIIVEAASRSSSTVAQATAYQYLVPSNFDFNKCDLDDWDWVLLGNYLVFDTYKKLYDIRFNYGICGENILFVWKNKTSIDKKVEKQEFSDGTYKWNYTIHKLTLVTENKLRTILSNYFYVHPAFEDVIISGNEQLPLSKYQYGRIATTSERMDLAEGQKYFDYFRNRINELIAIHNRSKTRLPKFGKNGKPILISESDS